MDNWNSWSGLKTSAKLLSPHTVSNIHRGIALGVTALTGVSTGTSGCSGSGAQRCSGDSEVNKKVLFRKISLSLLTLWPTTYGTVILRQGNPNGRHSYTRTRPQADLALTFPSPVISPVLRWEMLQTPKALHQAGSYSHLIPMSPSWGGTQHRLHMRFQSSVTNQNPTWPGSKHPTAHLKLAPTMNSIPSGTETYQKC